MRYLIIVTQTLLCLVSMVLTGLFALSISGGSFDSLTKVNEVGGTILLSVLFLVIGFCIDLGKYLFWSQRHHGICFLVISLMLMIFSWLASCAFLISAESEVIKRQQIESSEYKAALLQIESINQEIAYQEQLLKKRLSSSYHKQWAEGEKNVRAIAELRAGRVALADVLSGVGKEVAMQQVPVTALFSYASQFFSINENIARFLGFGLLSMLLEVSTLGMISLVQLYKKRENDRYRPTSENDNASVSVLCDEGSIVIAQQSVIRLICDILSGKSPPVFRKIRELKYGLDVSAIRHVLQSLYAVGFLKEGKRNSYELAVDFVGTNACAAESKGLTK